MRLHIITHLGLPGQSVNIAVLPEDTEQTEKEHLLEGKSGLRIPSKE